jgi:predicted transcriptional regulator
MIPFRKIRQKLKLVERGLQTLKTVLEKQFLNRFLTVSAG